MLPLLAVPALASEFNGAGSSAAAPLYLGWSGGYWRESKEMLNYDPVGSSRGMEAIRGQRVDFGATDVPPSAEEMARRGWVLVPTAVTGVVPVVNLPRLVAGRMQLNGELLARIYLGKISHWNDPAIAALNPGLNLPPLPIQVLARAEGAGTTYNFSAYLSVVSAAWRQERGSGFTVVGPVAKKIEGGAKALVKTLQATEGAITVVDFNLVREERLNDVRLPSRDGRYLRAGAVAFSEAVMNSRWMSAGEFSEPLIARPGGGSWPITTGTFVVLPRVADKPERVTRVANFLLWGFRHGDQQVRAQSFVKLPDLVQAKASSALSSIQTRNGQNLALQFF